MDSVEGQAHRVMTVVTRSVRNVRRACVLGAMVASASWEPQRGTPANLLVKLTTMTTLCALAVPPSRRSVVFTVANPLDLVT